MPQLSPAATNVSWLISNFVERVPGVDEAVVVSSDGLLMAVRADSTAHRPIASPQSRRVSSASRTVPRVASAAAPCTK